MKSATVINLRVLTLSSILISIMAIAFVITACPAQKKAKTKPAPKAETTTGGDESPISSVTTNGLEGLFYTQKYRSGLGEDSHLMTDIEVLEMTVEYFGISLPVGTEVIGGVHHKGRGELAQVAAFKVPPREVKGFLRKVRQAWRDPTYSGPTYYEPVETTGATYDDFWGTKNSEMAVTMRLRREDPLKKRYIKLNLDPETGYGKMSWTRD